MNIAIVGAGRQGSRLMDVLQQHEFEEIRPCRSVAKNCICCMC